MSRKITIQLDEVLIDAELYDNVTADKIWDDLPIEGVGEFWGEEVYFRTNIRSQLDKNAKTIVELGDIGYWPPANAICIFYGKTPNSTISEIKPASAVNIIGKVISDISLLKSLNEDCEILVSKKE